MVYERLIIVKLDDREMYKSLVLEAQMFLVRMILAETANLRINFLKPLSLPRNNEEYALGVEKFAVRVVVEAPTD